MSLSVLGTLAFIATQPRFAFIEAGTGQFIGIALFLVSGVAWAVFGRASSKE